MFLFFYENVAQALVNTFTGQQNCLIKYRQYNILTVHIISM